MGLPGGGRHTPGAADDVESVSSYRSVVLSLTLAVVTAGCGGTSRDSGGAGAAAQPAAVVSPTPAAGVGEGRHGTVLIEGVPHVEQKPDFCGEAAAEMALRHFGKPYDQDQVFALSGMSPERGMGATTRELQTALTHAGFEVGPVWHTVAANNAAAGLEQLFGELHADLAAGVPSIVCMHYSDRPNTTEHFRLVLGYDAAKGEVIYHEPAEQGGAYRRMDRAAFLKLWPLKYTQDRWTVVRFALEPAELRDPPRLPVHSPADFAQHVMKLKERLPPGFTIVVEPPFVVIGNDTPERVKRSATGTVRWAVRMLKQDYFKQDPKRILDVWLFKDRESYRAGCRRMFGELPGTPYGFYTDVHHALVMNIATGGGTLVHEIVHPFVEANFPGCPAWFNEGLGSLYEQSASRGGHIVGLTNWRLAGLQKAIRLGRVPTFAELTATSSSEFYDADPGTNYAQSRYLLYYLQEQGQLVRYYHEFLANKGQDPTGYRTLKRVLGADDMVAFQRRWEGYVLGLRFP